MVMMRLKTTVEGTGEVFFGPLVYPEPIARAKAGRMTDDDKTVSPFLCLIYPRVAVYNPKLEEPEYLREFEEQIKAADEAWEVIDDRDA